MGLDNQSKSRCRLTVFRFDPTLDKEPRYEAYEVSYDQGDRILDVLIRVREDLGKDLTFRWSCKNRICGSCGIFVNGAPKLLCWDEALPEMRIEPLPHFPVIKDLVVDRSVYDARIQEMQPYLEPREPRPTTSEISPETLYNLKPEETRLAVKFQECIECLLCVSVCPVTDGGRALYPGPAALTRLAQYTFDPRDNLPRVELAFNEHIYDCVRCYSCEKVCPVEIPVVTGISRIEGMAKKSGKPKAKHLREMVEGYF